MKTLITIFIILIGVGCGNRQPLKERVLGKWVPSIKTELNEKTELEFSRNGEFKTNMNFRSKTEKGTWHVDGDLIITTVGFPHYDKGNDCIQTFEFTSNGLKHTRLQFPKSNTDRKVDLYYVRPYNR